METRAGVNEALGSGGLLMRCASLVALVAALAGCAGPKFEMTLVDTSPTVEQHPVRHESPDGEVLVAGLEVTLPGIVGAARYDPASGLLLARYQPQGGAVSEGRSEYMIYDTATGDVKWTAIGNPNLNIIIDGVAVLSYAGKDKVYDAATGAFLRDAPPNLKYVDPGDVILSLTAKEFSRVDLTTGETIWERKGGSWQGFLQTYREGDWCYVVTDELHGFRFEDGAGWDYPASTCHRATGKAFAKDVALGVLGALVGAPYVGSSHAELTHNVCSQPLEVDGRVFFAARKKLVCLDGDSGESLWEADLGDELGSMWIYDADENIGVVGLGYTYVDYVMKPSEPPTIILVTKDSGSIVGQVTIGETPGAGRPETDRRRTRASHTTHADEEEWENVVSATYAGSHHYLLTEKQLYQMAPDLTLLGIVDAARNQGRFQDFLADTIPLPLRTTRGIVLAGDAPLEVTDFVDLLMEGLRYPATSEAAPAGTVGTETQSRTFEVNGVTWMEGPGGRHLFAVQVEPEVETLLGIPMESSNWRVDRGSLVAIAGNRVTILSLDLERSEDHLDG